MLAVIVHTLQGKEQLAERLVRQGLMHKVTSLADANACCTLEHHTKSRKCFANELQAAHARDRCTEAKQQYTKLHKSMFGQRSLLFG